MLDLLEAPATLSQIDRRRINTVVRKKVRREGDAPARVLLVEDTADVRKLIKFLLQDAGVQVMALGDGRSAAEMIENWPAPDLVIMDRMLPFLSGDELIQQIRASDVWGRVPIVVVSAKARSDDIAQSMADGADDYVTKPFNPKHFAEVIHQYV